MEKEEAENPEKAFPPAPTCVTCGLSLEEVGGYRIVGNMGKRVAIRSSPDKVRKDQDRAYFGLSSGFYLILLGGDRWTLKERERALDQAKEDWHPWMCQRCTRRVCKICGDPLKFPLGSNALHDDGREGHWPILPIRLKCSSQECENA